MHIIHVCVRQKPVISHKLEYVYSVEYKEDRSKESEDRALAGVLQITLQTVCYRPSSVACRSVSRSVT